MTAMRYEFLSKEVPLWISTPSDKYPDDEQLREIAKVLDVALLFDDECKQYLREVLAALEAFKGHARDAKYLQALPDEQLKDLLGMPFSKRTDDELRAIPLEQLAMNPVAIDQLFAHLAAGPLGDAWLEIHDKECDRVARCDGIGWPDVERIAKNAGIDLNWDERPAEEMAGMGRSLTEQDPSEDEKSKDSEPPSARRPRVIRLHLSATDPRIQWESGGPSDAHAHHLDVEIIQENPRRLRVRTAGIAYVEPGCGLALRWLTDELGTVNAEATLDGVDTDVLLDASAREAAKALVPSHVLEIRFVRPVEPAYSIEARVPIRKARSNN